MCGEKRVMRDAKELYEYFVEQLQVVSAVEIGKPMLNRIFFFISAEEMVEYHKNRKMGENRTIFQVSTP